MKEIIGCNRALSLVAIIMGMPVPGVLFCFLQTLVPDLSTTNRPTVNRQLVHDFRPLEIPTSFHFTPASL